MTTYRDDHEAALMRIDALEGEVRRMRKEAEAKPKPPAPKRTWRASLAKVSMAASILGIGAFLFSTKERKPVFASPPPPPVLEEPAGPIAVPADVGGLRACIAKITPAERPIDHTTTDPRGAAGSPSAVVGTGAECRDDLRELVNKPLPEAVRERLARWSAAEDQLAGTISLITVYYGGDPYVADNYTTAPQLWREYHRARDVRDDALGHVKRMLEM